MSKCVGLAGLVFGHKYEPRYHHGAPTVRELEQGPVNYVIKLLEASKPKTYVGDACTRCGNVVLGSTTDA